MLGSGSETFHLVYGTKSGIKDKYGNDLQNDETQTKSILPYEYLSDSDKKMSQFASIATLIILILGFAANFLLPYLMGGKLEQTWLLMGNIQLISLLPLCSVNLPPLFTAIALKMMSVHGEIKGIPNVFKNYLGYVRDQSYNARFSLLDIDSKFLMFNAGSNAQIWLIIIVLGSISWFMFNLSLTIDKYFFHVPRFISKFVTKIDSTI